MSVLKQGMRGVPVKRIQERLDINADGDFGAQTLEAVLAFQKRYGLMGDGLAGPDTFVLMGLPELVLLHLGSQGEQVKRLQDALGVSADGFFGPKTHAPLCCFQKINGLRVDGLAGPATLSKMAIFSHVITAEVVSKASVRADEGHFETAPLPTFPVARGIAPTVRSTTSVWGRIQGWVG